MMKIKSRTGLATVLGGAALAVGVTLAGPSAQAATPVAQSAPVAAKATHVAPQDVEEGTLVDAYDALYDALEAASWPC